MRRAEAKQHQLSTQPIIIHPHRYLLPQFMNESELSNFKINGAIPNLRRDPLTLEDEVLNDVRETLIFTLERLALLAAYVIALDQTQIRLNNTTDLVLSAVNQVGRDKFDVLMRADGTFIITKIK